MATTMTAVVPTHDWFQLAGLSVADAVAHFGVPPKSPAAIVAGSVGPWEKGGISPFQERCGRELAAGDGRPYEAFGASTPAGP